jgi:amidophosphoribosyltransferase
MCGIFGIYNHSEASKLTYLGLYSLQHRGQESAGIASTDEKQIYSYVQMGLVSDIFDKENLAKLKGKSAIGHVRYSTAGPSYVKNCQPLVIDYTRGKLALGHNGNLINAANWRVKLEKAGAIFQTSSDSEVILHLIAKSRKYPIEEAVKDALSKVKGAYSLLLMTPYKIIAARDPWGVRPLCIGKLQKSWIVASESCSLDLINAKYIREVKPGEIVVISKKGLKSIQTKKTENNCAFCVFEHIYFSRPDSTVYGESVYSVRKKMGAKLAEESMRKIGRADIVFSVPDSANSAAIGFSQASGLPYETGLIRNHYVGRTFIEPDQRIRDFGAKIKYNAIKDILKGKDIVVVDDSIVRGTTSRKLVKMIRSAGAKKVHVAVSSPPIISSCFYGIDTPTTKELIASANSVEKIRKFIEVDTLNYLSLEGMMSCLECPSKYFCNACFTRNYRIK